MVMAYNRSASHRLEPIAGFDEITHLQYTAPARPAVLNIDNGSGNEPGLPAGSVVSITSKGDMIPGATSTSMPMFLLWNTADPDMPGSATTADGLFLAGISGNGAYTGGPTNSTLLTDLYKTDENGNVINTSGGANSLTIDSDGNYALIAPTGNYTCWPATCGLELTTTEFDYEKAYAPNSRALSTTNPFKPNALLTGAVCDPAAATTNRAGYQKRRGGYLTTVDLTAEPAKQIGTDANGFAVPEDVAAEVAVHNICGTVSRGIQKNENAIDVLYFWAERTLLPKLA